MRPDRCSVHWSQCAKNMIVGPKYKYKYIWDDFFLANTNKNNCWHNLANTNTKFQAALFFVYTLYKHNSHTKPLQKYMHVYTILQPCCVCYKTL